MQGPLSSARHLLAASFEILTEKALRPFFRLSSFRLGHFSQVPACNRQAAFFVTEEWVHGSVEVEGGQRPQHPPRVD